MKILIAGGGGYIGTGLTYRFAEENVTLYCLARSADRVRIPPHLVGSIHVIEADLLDPSSLHAIPKDLDAAYYLVHSMGHHASGFMDLELKCANHFLKALERTKAKQIIYLSGFSHEAEVSEHMASRNKVDQSLRRGKIPVTTLHAGIVIGSGSASFEIIRDLVEKLPIMFAPRWIRSKCQPIALTDVLYYLKAVLLKKEALGRSFDIGGPNILTYKEMLIQFAQARKLKRVIFTVPILTPRLSSLWLYLVTCVDFSIGRALVNSLLTDSVMGEKKIDKLFPRKCLTYKQAIKRAFQKIEQNAITWSWKNTLTRSHLSPQLKNYIQVPHVGCLRETCTRRFKKEKGVILEKLWNIGGRNGWYFLDWTWEFRGFIDRITGGVGLRRGRSHPSKLNTGDALDFWRVLLAEKENGYLLLYAEMRVPGEAWLEWKISEEAGITTVIQTATFRPRGVLGRLYWYALLPIHKIIFWGLCKNLG